MTTHKIIITDDHPLLIDGLKSIFAEQENLVVCATAKDGKQLLQQIPLHQPDLILLDINLPEIDGIEAASIIKNRNPEIKILCVSTYYSKNLLDKLKAIPVEGFIPKQIDSPIVLSTVNKILAGEEIYIKSSVEKKYEKEEPKEIKLLTEREKEIVRMIKKGFSSKEIATKLFLSTYTIDTHRKNICAKLNLENPGALLRYVMEQDME